jgi:hypothetical protein
MSINAFIVDNDLVRFWGGQPTRKDLSVCEVLGLAKCRESRGRDVWTRTRFAKLFEPRICTDTESVAGDIHRLERRFVQAFGSSVDPRIVPAEMSSSILTLQDRGIVCSFDMPEGAVLVATAKGVFCDRKSAQVQRRLRKLFEALQQRGLMQRERGADGEWVWTPTAEGREVVELDSTSRPAMFLVFDLKLFELVEDGLGRVLKKVIDDQIGMLSE